MDSFNDFIATLILAGISGGAVWGLWQILEAFFGGPMYNEDGRGSKYLTLWRPGAPKEEGPQLVSRRCVKCGIHPDPSQMKAMFGEGWEHYTYCTACREKKEVLVIMVPKLMGMDIEDIKPYYMSARTREFARKTYTQGSWSTKLYISDGQRFWNWLSWPYNLSSVIKWDEFIAACPDWKVIEPEEKAKTYPDIKDYVSC